MEDFFNDIGNTVGGYVPTLLAALAVLLVGWLVALLVASAVRRLLGRTQLDNRLVGWVGGDPKGGHAEKWLGRVVFWVLMIFVLLAFFQVLGLAQVAGPLASFQTQLFSYIPGVLMAAALLVLAWLIATAVRLAVRKGLHAVHLDERLGESADLNMSTSTTPSTTVASAPTGTSGVPMPAAQSATSAPVPRTGAKPASLTKTLADTAYWLVFLLFLPAVLDALGLEGLLAPVNDLVGRFLGFLPNVFAALLIVAIGWLVARIVRRVVTNLLVAVGVDRLSQRVEMQGVLGNQRLSGVLGVVVYVLIMIPVIIAGLNALQLEAITQPASGMLDTILAALPRLFAAGLLLVLAYVIAKLVSGLVVQLLSAMGFDTLFARLGFGAVRSPESRSPSQIAGSIVLIAILLFASIEALQLLDFTALALLLSGLTVFLGKVALGVLVFAAGLYLADLAARTIRSSGLRQAALLATIARVAILILAGAMALRQMDVAEDIINMAFGLTLGALAVASAIAFGIGGRDFARRRLDELEAAKFSGGSAPSSTPPR